MDPDQPGKPLTVAAYVNEVNTNQTAQVPTRGQAALWWADHHRRHESADWWRESPGTFKSQQCYCESIAKGLLTIVFAEEAIANRPFLFHSSHFRK